MSTSYDEFAYPCTPQALTHPDLLATMATLHGMSPVPPGRCRVLELGCNDGSNLIPMAANDPESHYTGIDLAATAVAAAVDWSARLGLSNTEFIQGDILEWKPGARVFDYILIHGVYSWVPEPVREAILKLCRASLSPNGIAYISYNALPGCHFRRYVWDVLRFHTRALIDPRQKIAAAREIASKMCEWLGDVHQQPVIRKEFELVLNMHDSVLLHDDLAEFNTPFQLSDFVEAARGHGLQYICDARFSRDSVDELDMVCEDWLAKRQYADFVTGRKFRSSLLCHKELQLDHAIGADRLANLLASSSAEAEPAQSDGTQKFRLGDEKSLSTNHPVAKRILTELAAKWPGWTPVSDLPFESLERAAGSALLLQLYEARALELRLRPPRLVPTVSAHPMASTLARMQLASGLEVVTNQRHICVALTDALSRQFLLLLDGTRDRAALLRDLTAQVNAADLPQAWAANQPAGRFDLALMIDQGLDRNLAGMARSCLLVR